MSVEEGRLLVDRLDYESLEKLEGNLSCRGDNRSVNIIVRVVNGADVAPHVTKGKEKVYFRQYNYTIDANQHTPFLGAVGPNANTKSYTM